MVGILPLDGPVWLVLLVAFYVVTGLTFGAVQLAKAVLPPPSDRLMWWQGFFEHRRAVAAARRDHRRAVHRDRREHRNARREAREARPLGSPGHESQEDGTGTKRVS